MPRLFVALPIDRQVVQELVKVGGAIAGGWRRVEPGAMHLTLAFLGEVPEGDIPRAADAMTLAAAASMPLDLRAEGLSAFPDARRARVLWAGVEGDIAALVELQSDLSARLERAGFQPDDRPFRPHVTIARSREARPLPAGLDARASFGGWRATEICLVESRLGAAGSTYVLRERAELAGSDRR